VRLNEIVEQMHNGCCNDQSFDYKNSAEVKTCDYRAKIGYNLNYSCQGNVEGKRFTRVELILGTHKVTQTDDGPDNAHYDNSDTN
jgi:hypothetical protein